MKGQIVGVGILNNITKGDFYERAYSVAGPF